MSRPAQLKLRIPCSEIHVSEFRSIWLRCGSVLHHLVQVRLGVTGNGSDRDRGTDLEIANEFVDVEEFVWANCRISRSLS